jgi:hypothetical protein
MDFHALECLTHDDRSLIGEILSEIKRDEKEQIERSSGRQSGPGPLPSLNNAPKTPTQQNFSSRSRNSSVNIPKFPTRR